jgi:hypothetical protein
MKGRSAADDASILLSILSMDDASSPALAAVSGGQTSSRQQVNDTCLDLLLSEIVAHTFSLYATPHEVPYPSSAADPLSPNGSLAPTPSMLTADHAPDVHPRLDGLGYRVGMALAERYTKDRPHMSDDLDVIKFICKDFWLAVFRRQIDNLRTNHRGVYVLQDNTFKWLSRASTAVGGADAARRAQPV